MAANRYLVNWQSKCTITDKPVVINKEITIRPMMNLSLTTDHSLVDGALSAKFLKGIEDIIENPYLLI